jgi:hypothetical protein
VGGGRGDGMIFGLGGWTTTVGVGVSWLMVMGKLQPEKSRLAKNKRSSNILFIQY